MQYVSSKLYLYKVTICGNILAENGLWTKIMAADEGPSARFSMAGEILGPHMQGVLVFIGGCNRHLEALDDFYYLHTGYFISSL